MLVVAGLSLKNLEPRVWDPNSPYYLSDLKAIMVSYADFIRSPTKHDEVVRQGLRDYLNVPDETGVFLDNGAFYFLNNGGKPDAAAYRKFVAAAQPDWWPIRFDAIPTPQMSVQKQRACFDATMKMNRAYTHNGYVPVIHVGRFLSEFIQAIEASSNLSQKPRIALGGLVPNLLRAPKAMSYEQIIKDLRTVRDEFADKEIHVFGVGGTATLHIAGLLGFDSVDSSGWRNRAARGIIQLPGRGDRFVAELGNWRGRRPSAKELSQLEMCPCPACQNFGLDSLRSGGLPGFSHRATHNLSVLLDEARWIEERLRRGTYRRTYKRRLENSTYLPLIEMLLNWCPDVD